MEVTWQHPFTCIVAGPTKAGKTQFVKKFVKYAQSMVYPAPAEIIWCYTEWQKAYEELAPLGITFIEGVPPIDELKKSKDIPKLLILDDLMTDLQKDKSLVNLFARGCHHWNISCIHIVQNIFYDGLRTSRVNAQYLVLMKNPSDRLQAMNLARQLFPKRQTFFTEALDDATQLPHSYLLIDLNQNMPDIARLRTNIFPDELQVCYVPKNI